MMEYSQPRSIDVPRHSLLALLVVACSNDLAPPAVDTGTAPLTAPSSSTTQIDTGRFHWNCDNNLPSPTYASPGKIPTSSMECTPGEATFQLGEVALIDRWNHTSAMVVPWAIEPATFPEHAWLREIEVLDWGSATGVHIAEFGEYMYWWHHDRPDCTEDLDAFSGPSRLTFPAGEHVMSDVMGVSGVTADADVQLPTLRIRWSCELDEKAPHTGLIRQHRAFVATVPELAPITSRLVLWWAADDRLYVGPEGRFPARFRSDIPDDDLPGRPVLFTIDHLGGSTTEASGRLFERPEGLELRDARIVHDHETLHLEPQLFVEHPLADTATNDTP